MNKKITLNKLIQYHYNEISPQEKLEIKKALQTDKALKAESHKLLFSKRILDRNKRKPSATSIRFILDYNRKSQGEFELAD